METFLRSILLGKEKGGCSFVLSIPHVEWSFNRGWCWQKGDGKGLGEFFGAVKASRLAYPCFQK